MNRTDATYAVGDIIEKKCRNCDHRAKMGGSDAKKYTELQTYCINDCPVGAELQELSKHLGGPFRRKMKKNLVRDST